MMMLSARRLRSIAGGLATGLAASVLYLAMPSASAAATGFPDKPVKIVVPFAPGGLTDALARRVAGLLSDAWGQPVVVENRPGASGNIGHEAVARSPGDGHTLLFTSGSFTINPSLYRNLGYDVEKDFRPVTLVATVPSVLLVPAKSPLQSFDDFIGYTRGHPGKLNYGSAGNGSPQHLAMELLKSMAKLHIVHLPYKGGAPALADLIGGQTDLMFAALPEATPHIKGGRLRALAISSPQRSAVMSSVPTIRESGVEGFEAIGWQGLLAPGTTPQAVVDKIHADLAKALTMPETRSAIDAMGIEFSGDGPAGFGKFLSREVGKWAEVVRKSGARID